MGPLTPSPETSVVLPVYRNRQSLDALYTRLVAVLGLNRGTFEIVFVNDCCPDGSLAVLRRLAGRDARVRVVALEERSGQLRALRAGLAAVTGRTVVTMDADLQDLPEAIPQLLAALAGGYAAAYAGRRGRYESSRRLASSWLFKHAMALVTGMPSDAGSFIAMRRDIADRVLAFPDRAPYLAGAVAWAVRGSRGQRHTSIPVVRDARPDGCSSYTAGMRLGMGARALRWRICRVGR
jgi:glycosyltransferase involved in cell wall biosynthesis